MEPVTDIFRSRSQSHRPFPGAVTVSRLDFGKLCSSFYLKCYSLILVQVTIILKNSTHNALIFTYDAVLKIFKVLTLGAGHKLAIPSAIPRAHKSNTRIVCALGYTHAILVYACAVLLLVGWSINFYTTRGRLPSC